jgi:hypothetical protein
MIELVNDAQAFEQLQQYLTNYFKEYTISSVKQGVNSEGLGHMFKALDGAIKQMEYDFKQKEQRRHVDETV